MQRISLAAAPRQPWKNGGGETRELAVAPPGAGLDDFDWRISCAQVARGGPFSPFPDIDRSLLVLEGAGIRLHVGDGGPLSLGVASAPLRFAGEQPVVAELLDGPVGDFNVMTRRGRWRHRLQVLALQGRRCLRREADRELLYCTGGRVQVWPAQARSLLLEAGEGLWCAADSVALAPRCGGESPCGLPPVRLLRVQLWRC